ncbi:hypothetical protein [Pseudomonas sp. AL15]|uniref:hypothetical protein n=1 Tax=Pseudomonas sp. AL15 TaxID=3042236 RepID=UPI00249C1840|nr:hypothetical protein [Pseudomonas sp. AL15]MDI3269044.1 hypothetical protein [Pseudomonas sp. AL15]
MTITLHWWLFPLLLLLAAVVCWRWAEHRSRLKGWAYWIAPMWGSIGLVVVATSFSVGRISAGFA